MIATVIAEINAALLVAMPTLQFGIGGRYLHLHNAPPRIVWVPIGGSWAPPVQLGKTYRSIRTRQPGFDVHCWGVSYDQAESLLHNLVLACYKSASTSFAVSGERWLQPGTVEWLTQGEVVVLPVTFKIPVLDQYVDIPTATADVATPPDASTTITVVEDDPAEGEMTIGLGDTDIETGRE